MCTFGPNRPPAIQGYIPPFPLAVDIPGKRVQDGDSWFSATVSDTQVRWADNGPHTTRDKSLNRVTLEFSFVVQGDRTDRPDGDRFTWTGSCKKVEKQL
jgi:hypothetical protein